MFFKAQVLHGTYDNKYVAVESSMPTKCEHLHKTPELAVKCCKKLSNKVWGEGICEWSYNQVLAVNQKGHTQD